MQQTEAPMESLAAINDFFAHFYKQSQESLGNLKDNSHTTLPAEANKPLEEYIKKQPAAPEQQAFAAPVSSPASASTPPTPTPQMAPNPNPQPVNKLSERIPRGNVPPGYKPTSCCLNCEYFRNDWDYSGGYCSKYDFNCRANYICDSFEFGESGCGRELYTDTSTPKQAVESPKKLGDPLATEMQGDVTAPQYVGDTLLTSADSDLHERLRSIAEKRVSILAAKDKREVLPGEVESELQRIKKARNISVNA